MKSYVVIALVLLTACGGEAPREAAAQLAAPQAAGDPATGKELIDSYACVACHRIPGFEGAQGSIGPSLAGIGSRSVMTTGVAFDRDTMVRYLQNPPAVDPQTRMPPLGITKEEAEHMTAYLFTLK